MREDLPFSNEEREFLQELARRDVQFMIVGLSAAALQGAPVVTQDVELWFEGLADPGISLALDKVGGTYVPPIAGNPPMFAGEAVKLFDIVVHMHGLGRFDEEKRIALTLQLGRVRINVLPLDRIIESKKATGRLKDRLVMKALRDAAATLRSQRAKNAGRVPAGFRDS